MASNKRLCCRTTNSPQSEQRCFGRHVLHYCEHNVQNEQVQDTVSNLIGKEI
jgi:hypothetical protein